MGLFDTKYIITVDVANSPLVSEAYRTDFIKTAVLSSSLSNGQVSAGEALVNNFTNGYSSHIDRFYRSVSRTPSLTTLTEVTALPQFNDWETIEDALGRIYQTSCEVNNAYIGSPIAEIFAKWYLYTNHGMIDGNTFEHPEEDATRECVYDYAEFVGTGLVIYFDVVVDPEDPQNTISDSTTVDFSYLDFSKDYLQVSFEDIDAEVPSYGHWVYIAETSELVFPELELENIELFKEDYYPIVVIRNNFDDLIDTISPENQASLDKALGYIGLDLQTLHDNILTDSADNDTSTMEDVFVMFAADVFPRDKPSKYYVYEYFARLFQRQRFDEDDFNDWVALNTNYPRVVQRNYFTFNEDNSFKTAIYFNYIKSEIVNVARTEPHFQIIVRQPIYGAYTAVVEMSELVIDMPINDTQCHRLTVHGLHQRHTVYDDPNSTQTKGMVFTLEDALAAFTADTNKGMFIPIARSAITKMPIMYKNAVLQNNLRVVVYSSNVQKVKWYEQGAFLAVIQIIVIAVSVITQQYQNVGWALALEVAGNILLSIIIGQLLVRTLQIVVEIIGLENTAIAAAIMLIAAVVFQVAPETAIFLDSAQLLQVVDATIEAGMNYLQESFQSMMQEFNDLLAEYKEAFDEIEAIQKDLNSGIDVDFIYNVIDATLMNNVYAEKPAYFYERTLTTNTAPMVLQAVSVFADRMLNLPKDFDISTLNTFDMGGVT